MTPQRHITFAILCYASVLIVALATAFVAIDQQDAIVSIDERAAGVGGGFLDPFDDLSHRIYTFGWPVVAGSHQITTDFVRLPWDYPRIDRWKIHWLATTLDLLAFVSIVLCTIVVGRIYLPRICTGRFSLSAVFLLLTMAAFFAWWLTLEKESFQRLSTPIAIRSEINDKDEYLPTSIHNGSISIPYGTYMPITYYAWWIAVPVLYGMACVLFVVLKLIGALFLRIANGSLGAGTKPRAGCAHQR